MKSARKPFQSSITPFLRKREEVDSSSSAITHSANPHGEAPNHSKSLEKIIFVDRGADVDKIDEMVRNKFSWNWLQERDTNGDFLSDYFRKIPVSGKGYCLFCSQELIYGSRGKSYIKKHSESCRHRCNRISRNWTPTVESPSVATSCINSNGVLSNISENEEGMIVGASSDTKVEVIKDETDSPSSPCIATNESKTEFFIKSSPDVTIETIEDECDSSEIFGGVAKNELKPDIFFVERGTNLASIERSVRNKFKWCWLEEKDENGDYLSDYFRKLPEPGIGFCMFCLRILTYGNKGKSLLMKHSQSKFHIKMRKERKDTPSIPAVASILEDEDSDSSTNVPYPYGVAPNVSERVKRYKMSSKAAKSKLKQKNPVASGKDASCSKIDKQEKNKIKEAFNQWRKIYSLRYYLVNKRVQAKLNNAGSRVHSMRQDERKTNSDMTSYTHPKISQNKTADILKWRKKHTLKKHQLSQRIKRSQMFEKSRAMESCDQTSADPKSVMKQEETYITDSIGSKINQHTCKNGIPSASGVSDGVTPLVTGMDIHGQLSSFDHYQQIPEVLSATRESRGRVITPEQKNMRIAVLLQRLASVLKRSGPVAFDRRMSMFENLVDETEQNDVIRINGCAATVGEEGDDDAPNRNNVELGDVGCTLSGVVCESMDCGECGADIEGNRSDGSGVDCKKNRDCVESGRDGEGMGGGGNCGESDRDGEGIGGGGNCGESDRDGEGNCGGESGRDGEGMGDGESDRDGEGMGDGESDRDGEGMDGGGNCDGNVANSEGMSVNISFTDTDGISDADDDQDGSGTNVIGKEKEDANAGWVCYVTS